METNLITVVIIEDHSSTADGIAVWLTNATPRIEVVAIGSRPIEAWSAPGNAADVVLFDLDHGSGKQEMTALRQLIQSGRHVVVYTQDLRTETAAQCLRLGALSCLPKSQGKEHLLAAVRAAAVGEFYLCSSFAGALMTDSSPDMPNLSEQERQCLIEWVVTDSIPRAAQKRKIKESTFRTYIQRIEAKYDAVGRPARGKAQLTQRALEDDLVQANDVGRERQTSAARSPLATSAGDDLPSVKRQEHPQ